MRTKAKNFTEQMEKFECQGCGEYFTIDESMVEFNEEALFCFSCQEEIEKENTSVCEGCGLVLREGDATDGLCEGCHKEQEDINCGYPIDASRHIA